MSLIQLKSNLGIYDYVLFTCEKNQGFKYMFNLCMRTINTRPSDPFLTFSTYLVLQPGNGKSEKSLTVVNITSTCYRSLSKYLSL